MTPWLPVAVLLAVAYGACGRAGETKHGALAQPTSEHSPHCAAAAEKFQRGRLNHIETHYSPTFERCFVLETFVLQSPDRAWTRGQTLWDAQHNRVLAVARGLGGRPESRVECSMAAWNEAVDCGRVRAYIKDMMSR